MKSFSNHTSKEDLIDLINHSDNKLAFVDREYIYRIVNQKYLDAFQKPIDEIIGHSVSEVLGTDIFENTVKPYLDRAFNGENIQYEAWFEFPNLPRQYLVVSYYPSFDKNMHTTGVTVTVNDITKRKQLEEDNKFYEYLMISQSRTVQLGEMIAFIAHQWRTPLNTLNTYLLRLQMEFKTYMNKERTEMFERSEKLIEQLSGHIEDLYLFYDNPQQTQQIKLKTAVQQAIALHQHRLHSTHINVKIDIVDECTISCHMSYILHICSVFLENAIDSLSLTDQIDKEILIKATCDENFITIDILDNGDGISSDIAKHIFDAGVSTKSLSGHGYGLYFANKLIKENFGGSVCTIANDIGAWFRITIPKT